MLKNHRLGFDRYYCGCRAAVMWPVRLNGSRAANNGQNSYARLSQFLRRVFLQERLLGGRQRQESKSRNSVSGLTGQRTKSEALVESNGLIAPGIHEKRERSRVRPQNSGGCIGQKRRAQATPLKSLAHG